MGTRYNEATVAALIAGLGVVSTGLFTGRSLSAQEWVGAAIAALVALGGVYQARNRSAT